MQTIVQRMKICAKNLYANNEQCAYAELQEIIPIIIQYLQQMSKLNNMTESAENLLTIKGFLKAYQKRDNLALADSLNYELPNIIGNKENELYRKK